MLFQILPHRPRMLHQSSNLLLSVHVSSCPVAHLGRFSSECDWAYYWFGSGISTKVDEHIMVSLMMMMMMMMMHASNMQLLISCISASEVCKQSTERSRELFSQWPSKLKMTLLDIPTLTALAYQFPHPGRRTCCDQRQLPTLWVICGENMRIPHR